MAAREDTRNNHDRIALGAPAPPPGRLEVGLQYFVLGFTHILPNGFDHVLFGIGIFLLPDRWRSVLAQVSTFTVALRSWQLQARSPRRADSLSGSSDVELSLPSSPLFSKSQ